MGSSENSRHIFTVRLKLFPPNEILKKYQVMNIVKKKESIQGISLNS